MLPDGGTSRQKLHGSRNSGQLHASSRRCRLNFEDPCCLSFPGRGIQRIMEGGCAVTDFRKKTGSVLVTGGAGYVGSHVVLELLEKGERVVVLDDLSTGLAEAVIGAELVVGNVGDIQLVSRLIQDHHVDAVMHFAARTVVPESIEAPLRYYTHNTVFTSNLLSSCVNSNVKNFIFSSSAAVYGMPESGKASEETPPVPINPYGTSKLMSEWMLRDLATAKQLSYVALRYFNVAGADVRGRIGQSTRDATLLIKIACEVADGKRDCVEIYGTDFSTPDGTGVRDYIHVQDLACAHSQALDYLRANGTSVVLNCGYGHGSSVREVLSAVERACGGPLPVLERSRRIGDTPFLIADSRKIRSVLGWSPRYDDLDLIVENALAWERRLPGVRAT
ncbi:UDP-glucose 4-epimerase GalE [Xanthomonas euroxanthea]|uniref:UDP-glucose 4-epimerase GalE n=1 Tax=Xanthomonas euroxanthea TaxID=2259622 RepID=UPI002DD6B4C1|nr:UDP-glucose 4-epimerase GalE [Xanthomonas euroxanthea]